MQGKGKAKDLEVLCKVPAELVLAATSHGVCSILWPSVGEVHTVLSILPAAQDGYTLGSVH